MVVDLSALLAEHVSGTAVHHFPMRLPSLFFQWQTGSGQSYLMSCHSDDTWVIQVVFISAMVSPNGHLLL